MPFLAFEAMPQGTSVGWETGLLENLPVRIQDACVRIPVSHIEPHRQLTLDLVVLAHVRPPSSVPSKRCRV